MNKLDLIISFIFYFIAIVMGLYNATTGNLVQGLFLIGIGIVLAYFTNKVSELSKEK